MRLELAYISPRRGRLKAVAAQQLVDEYVERAARYCPATLVSYGTEEALLQALDRQAGRTPALLYRLDSRGRSLSSEAFAARLGEVQASAVQHLVLAIGPADGWSATARQRAAFTLSLGPMTLAHELALVVLAEQVYRALTILAGHPYHSGHGDSAG